MKTYVVYIICNKPYGVLYIGVTSDIKRRMSEHRNSIIDGFTKKYGLARLVYVELYEYIYDALNREKQLKRWHREWKINLIMQSNFDWIDLCGEMLGMDPETSSG